MVQSLLQSLTRNSKYSLSENVLKTSDGRTVEGSLAISTWLGSLIPSLQTSPKEDALVLQWLSKSHEIKQQLHKDRESALKNLDALLAEKTFLVSNKLTLADLSLYSVIHSTLATMSTVQRFSVLNVTRYFDLVQNLVHFKLNESKEPLNLKFLDIVLDAPADPKPLPKEKAKSNSSAPKEPKEKVKEPKEKAKAPAPKEKEQILSPGRIDLRIGHVTKVSKHPDADSLYVEEIDVGEEKPRQVVSGLVKHISEQDFTGKFVVLVCNLKPAKMRGIESQAMVLCASNAQGQVELVQPPAGSKPGDIVFFEGHQDVKPDAQLKSKEKVWETIQPKFATTAKKECAYIDNGSESLMKTAKGLCTVASIIGGQMK